MGSTAFTRLGSRMVTMGLAVSLAFVFSSTASGTRPAA
jgi:hypothetical protein